MDSDDCRAGYHEGRPGDADSGYVIYMAECGCDFCAASMRHDLLMRIKRRLRDYMSLHPLVEWVHPNA